MARDKYWLRYPHSREHGQQPGTIDVRRSHARHPRPPLGRPAGRGPALLYMTAVVGFRLAARRTLAEMNGFDFVAAVAVRAIVGRVPNADETGYPQGMATLVAVLACHAVLRHRVRVDLLVAAVALRELHRQRGFDLPVDHGDPDWHGAPLGLHPSGSLGSAAREYGALALLRNSSDEDGGVFRDLGGRDADRVVAAR
jgi:hypothetical protein